MIWGSEVQILIIFIYLLWWWDLIWGEKVPKCKCYYNCLGDEILSVNWGEEVPKCKFLLYLSRWWDIVCELRRGGSEVRILIMIVLVMRYYLWTEERRFQSANSYYICLGDEILSVNWGEEVPKCEFLLYVSRWWDIVWELRREGSEVRILIMIV